MAEDQPVMTSNRPYLLRAIYDWISDNDLRPHLLVDATRPGVRVPASAIRDGQVVLNIAMHAVADLDLGNERIRCKARFGGVSQSIDVPIAAVQAIYAQENGQGMMFPPEDEEAAAAQASKAPERAPPQRPSLQTVESTDQSDHAPPSPTPDEPPPKGPPKLRVIK